MVYFAEGSRGWDVGGHKYVDCFNGIGTVLLGHSHPVITEAIKAALKNPGIGGLLK